MFTLVFSPLPTFSIHFPALWLVKKVLGKVVIDLHIYAVTTLYVEYLALGYVILEATGNIALAYISQP